MIVTIDGPAGAGKSSVAKELANRLAFEFLDTGAMYRAVALQALRQDCDANDETTLSEIAASIEVKLADGRVHLNGEDVTQAIRRPEVTDAAGALAVHPGVRERLVDLQRRFAENRNVVTEGRDQGTVVFPNAECKFFLMADEAERAKRRHCEMTAKGDQVSLDEVTRAIQERDKRDTARKVAPLKQAADAILIDSTAMSLDEVIDELEKHVRQVRDRIQK